MIKKFKSHMILVISVFITISLTPLLLAENNTVSNNSWVNSFEWSLHAGLEYAGVTSSTDEIRATLGTLFSPVIMKEPPCVSSSIKLSEELMISNILLSFGLNIEEYKIGKKIWSSAVARQFLKTKIRYALAETNVVLIQGKWKPKSQNTEWGIITSIDFNGTTSGITPWGDMSYTTTPRKILILSPANYSLSPHLFRENILQTACSNLDGNKSLQKLISGIALINYIADTAHRTPYCEKCKNKSPECMYSALKIIRDNLSTGSRYLQKISEQYDNNEKRTLISAVNELLAGCDVLNALIDLKKIREDMSEKQLQAELGEEIRRVNNYLARAIQYINEIAGTPIDDLTGFALSVDNIQQTVSALSNETTKTLKYQSLWSSARESKQLVNKLPLYSRLRGINNSFLTSVGLAAEIAGISKRVEWIAGISGFPFRFLIETNLFVGTADFFTGYDCSTKAFNAAGLKPIYYISDGTYPDSVKNMIRKAIVNSINSEIPVVIRDPASDDEWGLIVGYKNYGLSFMCRLPGDSNSNLSTVYAIPKTSVTFYKSFIKTDRRAQIKNALKQLLLLHSNTNFNSYVSGTAALDYWINECEYYSKRGIMPPLDFADQNYKLWISLRDNLRSTYRFLDLVMFYVPELTAPLNEARSSYLNAVDLLNDAVATGRVLKNESGTYEPLDWMGVKDKQQINTLKQVKILIENTNEHISFALK